MTMVHRRSLWAALWFGAGLLLVSPKIEASPTPGIYELYDGARKKIGRVTAVISTSTWSGQPSTHVEVRTEIEIPGVVGAYRFTETDVADVLPDGLASFRRETDDNGTKSLIIGDRRGTNMVVNTDRNGKKVSSALPLKSFDLSEYELDLPQSKFATLKPGESRSFRVFYPETAESIPVSRNISKEMLVPYNDKKVPVHVTTTLLKGRATISWFHAKTHVLLQEEGPEHLMSRVAD
jgi:hypothetical protein